MIEVYRVAAGSQYGFFEFEEESVCCFDEASEVVRKSSFAGFTRLDLEVGDRAAVNMHQRLAAARLMLALGERERATRVLANGYGRSSVDAEAEVLRMEKDAHERRILRIYARGVKKSPFVILSEVEAELSEQIAELKRRVLRKIIALVAFASLAAVAVRLITMIIANAKGV